jgi:50S ribosomal subunit-associated GTPase HflX
MPWDTALHEQIAHSAHRPPLIVHNKCDLAAPPTGGRPAGIQISALTGQGIDTLCRCITAALVPAPPERNLAVPFTIEQIEILQAAAQQLYTNQIATAREQLGSLSNPIPIEGQHDQ